MQSNLSMPEYTLTVESGKGGGRLDSFIAAETPLSRNAAQGLLEEKRIFVNGKCVGKSVKLKEGDTVEIYMPEVRECEALPEDIPLDAVYEDDDVIVINKPQGMVVHPAPGHESGTLVNALLYRCKDSLSDINGVIRPGIVHRIDRDTSGLIIVAKNNDAHIGLSAQLEDHSLSRVYYAILCGRLKADGTVDAPIGRHKTDRKKMAISSDGRRAVTHYRQLAELEDGFSLAEMRLETGRTHQIRVHMAHIGHPVLGDPVYGRPTQFEKKHPAIFGGQFLHAGALSFIHPRTGERVTVEAPMPDNFKKALQLLGYNNENEEF